MVWAGGGGGREREREREREMGGLCHRTERICPPGISTAKILNTENYSGEILVILL